MTGPQPLSVRRGLRPAPAGPVQGVTPGMGPILAHWLEGEFGYRSNSGMREQLMLRVCMICNLQVTRTHDRPAMMREILLAASRSQDLFLDIIDAVLQVQGKLADASGLSAILREAGSAWTVSPDGRRLQEVVDPVTASVAAEAMSPNDAASAQLQEAWTAAYGRNPNASDAWDHAIKAIEAVLIPIVLPNDTKATLGSVLGDIGANPAKRTVTLTSSSSKLNALETIEELLRLVWPNPDRHEGGAGASRVPDLEEARTVLAISIMLVQMARAGQIS